MGNPNGNPGGPEKRVVLGDLDAAPSLDDLDTRAVSGGGTWGRPRPPEPIIIDPDLPPPIIT